MKRKKFFNIVPLLTLLTLFGGIFAVKPALAESRTLENKVLIDRVIRAYGGDKLINLKSLQVTDRYKFFSRDQGPNPDVNSVSLLNSTLTVDFSSDKKSIKNWRQGANGNRLSETLFDGQTGWSINHLRGTYVENKSLTAEVVGAGMMRMVDTVLALRLAKNRHSAEFITHFTLAGKAVTSLSFESANKEKYFVHVETSTGLIIRMSRNSDFKTGPLYEFGNHKKIHGLTFAADMNMLVNGEPSFITTSRSFTVNTIYQQAFMLPKDFTQLKGFIDSSKMTVNKLAEKVYLVGEGTRFSIFVDAGEYYIGGGGLGDITKRLVAINESLGVDKPIKVQVIPDHHRGHLGAVKELEEMGSRLVVAEQHRKIIESLKMNKDQDGDFLVIEKQLELANGLVEVFDINTAHADNYLLFYVPSAKLVFSAHHFGTNLIEALPGANNTIKTFRDEIERLNIDVEKYANLHGPRILSAADLDKVLSGYQVKSCPPEHQICMD